MVFSFWISVLSSEISTDEPAISREPSMNSEFKLNIETDGFYDPEARVNKYIEKL